jgi:hypothetical protein
MPFGIPHFDIVVSRIANTNFSAIDSTTKKILPHLGGISHLESKRLHSIDRLRGVARNKLNLLRWADEETSCRSDWAEAALAALRQAQSVCVEVSRCIEIANVQTNKGNS